MKNALFFAAGLALGLYAHKILPRKVQDGVEYISLDNVRRGIQNQWYKATIKQIDGEFFAHLVGMETDGDISDGYYPITQDTFYSLKEDGVEEED